MTKQELQQELQIEFHKDQFKVWQEIYKNSEVETKHRAYALRQMLEANNEIRMAGGKMLFINV